VKWCGLCCGCVLTVNFYCLQQQQLLIRLHSKTWEKSGVGGEAHQVKGTTGRQGACNTAAAVALLVSVSAKGCLVMRQLCQSAGLLVPLQVLLVRPWTPLA
jgi:hypothetical protein